MITTCRTGVVLREGGGRGEGERKQARERERGRGRRESERDRGKEGGRERGGKDDAMKLEE